MQIAFVNSTRKWGGVKTWSLDVSSGLQALGHKIFIYGRQEHFINLARSKGLKSAKINFGFDVNPLTIWYFINEFRTHNIQAVFVNVEKELSTAGVAAKLLNIPVIQQIGLPNDIPERFKTKALHNFVAPHFLCSCQYIAEGFGKSLSYLQNFNIKTILTSKTTTEHNLVCHEPRHLIVTQQLNKDKDHATLLKALAKIDLPFVCHIVGTGTDEASLKELGSRLGLENKLIWHGFTTDVYSLLKQADIFLLASLAEGLPNTLQEALAYGLLPIIRNVGGVCEVISPALEPWVLPYEADENLFAQKINEALQLNDDELLTLKNQARLACHTYCESSVKTKELEDWLCTELICQK